MGTAPAIDLPGRVTAVRDRIAEAGGNPEAVRLVAVTKGFDAGVVREALDAGLVDIGESYVQELVSKASELREDAGGPGVRWHFVGRLQRNKVRKAAPHVWLWHSVDRLALGAEIARWAPSARRSTLCHSQTCGAALRTLLRCRRPTKCQCTPRSPAPSPSSVALATISCT